jgi:hypothetical protein
MTLLPPGDRGAWQDAYDLKEEAGEPFAASFFYLDKNTK